jgi:DNA-binding protein HU-beta
VLAAFVGAIEAGLQRDGDVQIVGFGAFAVKRRKPRTGRNPVTGEPLAIAGSTTVGFRAGASLKDAVREPRR